MARPDHRPVLDWATEFELKKDLVREICQILRATMPEYQYLSNTAVSVLWFLPIESLKEKLQKLKEDSFRSRTEVWLLLYFRSALEHFFLAGTPLPRPAPAPPMPTARSGRPKTGPKADCLKRDGRVCIVTGTPDPVACHIIPFAWNSSLEQARRTGTILNRLSVFLTEENFSAFTLDLETMGASDKAWNMVSLNPLLQIWWGKGYWGFEVVDDIDEEQVPGKFIVMLRFHWMPIQSTTSPVSPNAPADFSNGGPQLNQKLRPANLVIQNMHTNRPVQTGDLFYVRLDDEDDANKFVTVMRLQWAMVKIQALAGAAGSPEIFRQYDDADLDWDKAAVTIRYIEEWLEETVGSTQTGGLDNY